MSTYLDCQWRCQLIPACTTISGGEIAEPTMLRLGLLLLVSLWGSGFISGVCSFTMEELTNIVQAPLSSVTSIESSKLSKLTSLDLGNNWLDGPIPPELGNLTRLANLSLENNNLSGSIPPPLGSLTELTSLSLGKNKFFGPIPAELGNLTKLKSLSLAWNKLSGPIPAALRNLVNLTTLDLSNNGLVGPIPSELSSLIHLESLSLASNQISGPILPQLSNLTNLTSLDLGNNSLSGPILPELSNLRKLTKLGLQSNNLVGIISPSFSRLTRLKYLSLGNNYLSGFIPSEFSNLRVLYYLNFEATAISCSYVSWPVVSVQELGLPCSPPPWVHQLALIKLTIGFGDASTRVLDLTTVPAGLCNQINEGGSGLVEVRNCSALTSIKFGPAFDQTNGGYSCAVDMSCNIGTLTSDTRREICLHDIDIFTNTTSLSEFCVTPGATRTVITVYSILGALAAALCFAYWAMTRFKKALTLIGGGLGKPHPLVTYGVYLGGVVGGAVVWADLYTDLRILAEVWGGWPQWVILGSILAPYLVGALFIAESCVASGFVFVRPPRLPGLRWIWPPPRMDSAAALPRLPMSPLRWAVVLVVWPLFLPAVVFLDVVAFLDKLGFHLKLGARVYGMELWFDSRSLVELVLRTVPQLGFQTVVFIAGSTKYTAPNVFIDKGIFLQSIALSSASILSQFVYTLWGAMVVSENPLAVLWRRIRCVGRSWAIQIPVQLDEYEEQKGDNIHV
ncbi:hypothetical protein KFL_002080190 [Klebsormidium nitens]|uniref:Uncharacterized protein n=1 Tax=Klebsormidium nitens TaxID=105231 RepID=A0A1Y1I4F6_KLENI|nr:hypothetical protein KFL_002080190 [Klebsormidium nitens]|eukprot:GAQ84842.1 hypothetical protein KFL_002080190 [Klebsormidium nitens]